LRPQPEARKIDEVRLKSEIAAAIAENVKPESERPPLVVQQQPATPQPAPHVCRGDALPACTDEELLQWGKQLDASIRTIVDKYMSELKKLDDIRGGNWLGQLVGISDKDSRWLKAYAQAQQDAAERFRDCCAANAYIYRRELLQRVGGEEKAELYRWVEDLTKSPTSKEYKKARQDSKVLDVQIDIDNLQYAIRRRDIEKSH
jgi:hypothetical protein